MGQSGSWLSQKMARCDMRKRVGQMPPMAYSTFCKALYVADSRKIFEVISRNKKGMRKFV